jgi:hypothetical protein
MLKVQSVVMAPSAGQIISSTTFQNRKLQNKIHSKIQNDQFIIVIIDEKIFFCSTLSEFENFLLCERILINVTTCQNETSG